MSDLNTEMYAEETPANEMKGFTKSFVKRGKQKKVEDKDVTELLTYSRENKLLLGAKITEKSFKKGTVEKVFVSSNCDELMLRKLEHYAAILNVSIVKIDLNSEELGQKLAKPFMVSCVCVRSN